MDIKEQIEALHRDIKTLNDYEGHLVTLATGGHVENLSIDGCRNTLRGVRGAIEAKLARLGAMPQGFDFLGARLYEYQGKTRAAIKVKRPHGVRMYEIVLYENGARKRIRLD